MHWTLSSEGLKSNFNYDVMIILFIVIRYRNEPTLSNDGDPLGWWRTRMEEYPTLVRLARKYLCVPATSAQAERVFSWMGWMLNKRRLSLSGESVLMQMFLKDNLEL